MITNKPALSLQLGDAIYFDGSLYVINHITIGAVVRVAASAGRGEDLVFTFALNKEDVRVAA